MSNEETGVRCERIRGIRPEAPILIEGLPGHGLVASIAVDQITTQLGLKHQSSIHAPEFPPVATFDDGVVQDLVRIYAGEDPPVLTLQSDLALPQQAFAPLSECVFSAATPEIDQAIFLAGAPAQSEDQLGTVSGVATTNVLRDELAAAGIEVATNTGVVGGITGALVRECYQQEIPATLLIVRAHPHLPDPASARAVIEDALEPLVEFEIDTTELQERAEEIQRQMQQIAQQYAQAVQEEAGSEPRGIGMYQ